LWRATALGAAGEPERARALLAPLEERPLPPGMRAALEARLEALPAPVELGASAQSVLDGASRELRAALLVRLLAPWRSWSVLVVLGVVVLGFASQLTGMRASLGLEALAVGPGEVLRPASLLTYGLLHYGWTHLLTNVVALAVVAPIVARGASDAGLLTVFFGGIVCAGLTVWQWSGAGLVVGASGGAMAVLAAAVIVAVAHPDSRGTRTAQAAWQAAAGLAVVQFTFDALVPQVSMTAHIGGALAGAWLVLPFVAFKRSRAG
jgi:membrane associated rhomboid family serine protease